MTKIAAGSVVEAYCTKCKLVLDHTIVALKGAKPSRVKCNTCGGDHNYRSAKPTAKAGREKSGKTQSRAQESTPVLE